MNMSTPDNKRIRGKNFTVAEEHLLVELVESNQHILECKKSDSVTWRQKDEAWQKLATQFTAQTGVSRPWKGLKDKYDNLKKKSRREYAEQKRETYRTGGGMATYIPVSTVSQKIGAMIQVSATGMENMVDDDAIIIEKDSDASMHEFVELDDDGANVVFEGDQQAEFGSPASFACWNPAKLKEKKSAKLSVCGPKKSLEEEKKILLQLQQDFYKDENARGEKKEREESEVRQLQKEKLLLEIEGIRLKNEMLQLDVALKHNSLH